MWKYKWYQNYVDFMRRWKWWDTYIYGKSLNYEDYYRNPAEVLRDTYFPFIIKGVKAYSIFNLRCGYIPSEKAVPSPQVWVVPMGDKGYRFGIGNWIIFDLRWLNPWYTKFCNAMFFLQFAVSLKHYIPIPYISMCIKIVPWYFQFGLGWGAETSGNAILCFKFRFVNEKTSNETQWNPSDVTGYREGTI